MTDDNTTYKLEIFEIFLISVPSLLRTLIYSVAVALFTSSLIWLAQFFGVGYETSINPVGIFIMFFASTVIGGGIIRVVVPSYPLEWGFFLALVNQLLASGVLVLGNFIPFVEPVHVFWIGAGMISLNTLEVLIITTGFRDILRIVFASLPQAGTYMGVFFVVTAPFQLRTAHFFVFTSAILLVLLVTAIAEGMVKVNINVKGFDFSAALTQHVDLDLGVGENTRRPIQKFAIENEQDSLIFLAPYFHPGLMAKIGGGRMSRDITKALSQDGVGSFLKPPTSHKSDPSDPESVNKILETQPTLPEDGCETASQLVEVESENLSFKSRKYGDTTIVFFDSERYDDVEFEVYNQIHDYDSTVIVDCHAHEPVAPRNLNAGTTEAEEFRSALDDVTSEADSATQGDYEAGFAEIPGDVPGFVLVEGVGEEKTILIGFDGNNISEEIRNLGKKLEESFDEVVLLTTDTHASPFQIEDQPRVDDIRQAVDSAHKSAGPASTRFAATRTPTVQVFDDFYTKLIDGFNIAARFFIVSLGLIYVYLIVMMLLI